MAFIEELRKALGKSHKPLTTWWEPPRKGSTVGEIDAWLTANEFLSRRKRFKVPYASARRHIRALLVTWGPDAPTNLKVTWENGEIDCRLDLDRIDAAGCHGMDKKV